MTARLEEMHARRERLLCAWHEWSSALIPAPLLQELEVAASESHLTLPHFVAELLESAAAARRLSKIGSIAHQGRARVPGNDPDMAAEPKDFPYPAETYRLLS